MRGRNPISSLSLFAPSLSVSVCLSSCTPQEALVKVMEDGGKRGEPERDTGWEGE